MSYLGQTGWGQTDFFWSTQDLLDGATNSDALLELAPGESGSLFLYYTVNGPANSNLDTGAFLDVATTSTGVVEFTTAETFDFDIRVSGQPVTRRWTNFNGEGGSAGETGTVSADFIDEWHAFTVTGGGIAVSKVFFDQGFDSGADAFLFGRVDFVATDFGSTDLILESGDGLIVNNGQVVPATFGAATIVVAGVPEPSGLLIAIVLLFGCTIQRRISS